MEYLHSKKIIHRDLKPENILITTDKSIKLIPTKKSSEIGIELDEKMKKLSKSSININKPKNYPIPKICDFGFSKIIDFFTRSSFTMQVGTFFYKSPEVIKSSNYDFKCDVYSFGIIMFNLLTGKFGNIYSEQQVSEMSDLSKVEFHIASDKNFKPKIDNPKFFEKKKKYEKYIKLMEKCYEYEAKDRPNFEEIKFTLGNIIDELNNYKDFDDDNSENEKLINF